MFASLKTKYVISLMLIVLLTTGAGTASAAPSLAVGLQASQGYKAAWTFGTSSLGEYDATLHVLQAYANGSVLYGREAVYSGSGRYIEVGLLNRNGAILWKREETIINVLTNADKLVLHESSPGYDHRVDRFLTIRLKDGAVMSSLNLKPAIGLEYIEDTNVTIDKEGRIYFVDAARLFAFSASGTLLWKKIAEIPAEWSSDPIYAPPIEGPDGNLYTWTQCYASQMCGMITDLHELISLDRKGTVRWSAPFHNSTDYLVFQNGQIIAGDSFSDIFAGFSAADGTKLWSYQAASGPWNMIGPASDPLGWTFIDAVDSDDYGHAITRYITALDASGKERWKLKLNEQQYHISGYSADGKSLFVEGENAVYSVSRSTGKATARRSNVQPSGKPLTQVSLNAGPNVLWGANQFTVLDRMYKSASKSADEQTWIYKAAPYTANRAPVGSVTFTAPPYADWLTAPNYDVVVWTSSQIRVFRPLDSVVSVLLNGAPVVLSQPAIVSNGVTMIPLRGLVDKAGVKIEWNPAAGTVTLTKESRKIKMTVGSKSAVVNGSVRALEAAPKVRNGVTMVPLRFILETLDASVTWDAGTQTVDIHTK